MQWTVKAMCVDPATGEVITPPREEVVGTDNALFASCTTPWEVEDRYGAFWNRLNDSWEFSFPSGKEKVIVLSVVEV